MRVQSQTSTTAPTNRFAQDLFRGLPARYDLLGEVLSFGQNARWRRAMVDQVVEVTHPSARILDVATGTAGVALQIATRTNADVAGVDLTEAMLREGQARVAARGIGDRVTLTAGDATALPFADATFDACTFTYLLRYVPDPSATVQELVRVLRPGAPMASLDFAVPGNPWWRRAWWMYTRIGLPVGGVLGGRDWIAVGRFLGPNISGFYARHPVAQIVDAWRDAGMVGVQARPMSLGGGIVMWGRKSGG